MRKHKLVIAALTSVILLQGCNPVSERFMDIFSDKSIADKIELEKSEVKPFQLDELFVQKDKFSLSKENEGYISLEQVYAVDGDTLRAVAKKSVLEAYGIDTSAMSGTANSVSVTIRYLLVDTPESEHPTKSKQPFSKDAANRNSDLLYSGKVSIEFGQGAKLDKYGRLLAYVYAGDTMIQETLLKEGLARIAYVEPQNTKYLDRLQAAEEIAKANKLKIWSITGYVTDRGFID